MRSFVLLALVSVAPGCTHDGHGEDPVDCAKEATADELVIGLSKAGENGLYTVSLDSFTPAPPARFLNEWTLSIMSTASPAAPLASNGVLAMTPYMPQHGHGAGVDVEIEAMPTAGEFKFSSINLHMPGIWEVTVEIDPNGANYDKVVFKPCIPE
ncbi:MAG: FixH family protein [Kofleriaceae bacterium]